MIIQFRISDDTVIPRKSKMQPLKIFHRYHFSSFFKRMTVIAGYVAAGTNETKHIVTVKGAPETLESMVCVLQKVN